MAGNHPVVHIYLDGDGAGKKYAGRECIHLSEFDVGARAGGMQSGLPSVYFAFDLPDGRWVFAETSLRAFLDAADAFKARYGDPR